MAEVKKFSRRRKAQPIEIEQEDGTVRKYTLKGLMGDQREEYISFLSTKVKLDKKGRPVGTKDSKGTHSTLIALGLYDENDALVPESEIKTYPGHLQGELYAELMEMSGFTDDAQEEAKN